LGVAIWRSRLENARIHAGVFRMAVLLALLLLSSPDVAERSTSLLRCREACERHLSGTGQSSPCALCLTAPDRTAWVDAAARGRQGSAALRSALSDEDWAVRWAALRAMARSHPQSEKAFLASWVMRAKGAEVVPACLTAARAAASQGQSSAAFLGSAGADGGRAAARVWEHRDEIRRALEVELYATSAETRREALAHLSRFLDEPPARVVLDAVASRPAALDGVAAALLAEDCRRARVPVDQALLSVAKPADQATANRLLAVYSTELDGLRTKLAHKDAAVRREAVAGLAPFAKLAAPELQRALEDQDSGVRLAAGRALAEAEGHSIAQHVRALSAGWASLDGMPESQRVQWVDVLARSGEGECGAVLKGLAQDRRLSGPLRAAALQGIGACAPKEAFSLVGPGLSDPSPEIRAASVRALGALPRHPGADDAAGEALFDSSPLVVVSAIGAVSAQMQARHTADVAALLEHPAPEVREAAARGLERLPGGNLHAGALAKRVREDGSAAVRAAAVMTLGSLGGPQAASALSAAMKDPDGRVQYLAKENLRRLGFGR